MPYEIRSPGQVAWATDIRDLREARRLLKVARRVIDWDRTYRIFRIMPKGDRVQVEEDIHQEFAEMY